MTRLAHTIGGALLSAALTEALRLRRERQKREQTIANLVAALNTPLSADSPSTMKP